MSFEEFTKITSINDRKTIHFLNSQSLAYEPNPVLKSQQLFVCHNIRIYLISKQICSFFSHIKFIQSSVLMGLHADERPSHLRVLISMHNKVLQIELRSCAKATLVRI